MARIVITVRQKSPLSPMRVELRVDHGCRDTIAEANLAARIGRELEELFASWGDRAPEGAGGEARRGGD